jgi:hypothetical protein
MVAVFEQPPCRSEPEKNRRRDQLYDLRNRREQMQAALKRAPSQADRYRPELSDALGCICAAL